MSSQERFWSKVKKAGPDDCWVWTGGATSHGYGATRWSFDGMTVKPVPAHRVAAFLSGIDTSRLIRHTCDNRRCCNPSHLLPGTHLDNSSDMVERGRQRHGLNGRGRKRGDTWRKLSDEDVASVRERFAAGETQANIARSFGVSHALINAIVRGKQRTHKAYAIRYDHPFIGR